MSKISINNEKCIGCGSCAGLCPQVFELGSDGKSKVKNENGKCDLKEAAESCPVQAISIK